MYGCIKDAARSYVTRQAQVRTSARQTFFAPQEIHDNMCKISRDCRECLGHTWALSLSQSRGWHLRRNIFDAAWDGYIMPPGASDPTAVVYFFQPQMYRHVQSS